MKSSTKDYQKKKIDLSHVSIVDEYNCDLEEPTLIDAFEDVYYKIPHWLHKGNPMSIAYFVHEITGIDKEYIRRLIYTYR